MSACKFQIFITRSVKSFCNSQVLYDTVELNNTFNLIYKDFSNFVLNISYRATMRTLLLRIKYRYRYILRTLLLRNLLGTVRYKL